MTNPSIHFAVEAEPRPQPRARLGKGGRFYTPDTVASWRRAIRTFAYQHMPAEPWVGPVKVSIAIGLPREEQMHGAGWPPGLIHADNPGSPDVDNLTKPIMDVLTELQLWVDDSQVVDQRTRKFYVAPGEAPAAWVSCELLSDPDDFSAMRLIAQLLGRLFKPRQRRKRARRRRPSLPPALLPQP